MKQASFFMRISYVLVASSLLFSCSKQISKPAADEKAIGMGHDIAATVTLPETDCKPAVFGYNSTFDWVTLAQKWYSGGKVSNLKAAFGSSDNVFPIGPFSLFIDWSQVTYQGNEVTLTRLPQNDQIMRVTLNAQGLPIAAYYTNNSIFAGHYYKDTSYLYYTGSRLDSMVSLVAVGFPASTVRNMAKYKFSYDADGNLVEVDAPDLSPIPDRDGTKVTLAYDLSKPTSGMVLHHGITILLTLLEYMELLKLPMHHAVTDFTYSSYKNGPGGPSTVSVFVTKHFSEYNISDGLVHSYVYQKAASKFTYYIGWDCGGGTLVRTNDNNQKKGITNIDELRQHYPVGGSK